MTESQTLLSEYATSGSEAAFRELLTRYLNLVYSTAVRRVGGDTHAAQDVTQTAFIDFARTAASLPEGVMLGGWLHRHTCYVASKLVRGERRRQLRERQAVEMNSVQNDHSASNLAQLAPVLDEAIEALAAEDRTAMTAAAKAYAQANNGQAPTEPAQIAPYLKQPLDPALVRNYLGKTSSSSTWVSRMSDNVKAGPDSRAQ